MKKSFITSESVLRVILRFFSYLSENVCYDSCESLLMRVSLCFNAEIWNIIP